MKTLRSAISCIAGLLLFQTAANAASFTWTIQSVGGERPSLAFDATGHPAIAFENVGVKYTTFNGSTWSTAQIVEATGQRPALAFNPANGKAQIALVDADNHVGFATLNGTWSVETVNATAAIFDPSLRSPNLGIDATGKPHIGWGGPFSTGNYLDFFGTPKTVNQLDYSYSTKEGGNWITELVEGPDLPFTGEHSSLALTSSGIPAIVFNSHTNGNNYRTKYSIRTGGVWSELEDAISDISSPVSALKFDPSNVAHLVYREGNSLMYATRAAGGVWTAETAADAAGSINRLSLVIHPVTAVPYLCYLESVDGGAFAVRVAHKTTGSWEVETVETGVVTTSAVISMNSSGTILGVVYDGKYASVSLSTELTITTGSALPGGTVTRPYTHTFQRINGTAAFTWSKVSGTYPDGLSLNGSTGELSGTPTTAGQSTSFRIKVTDGASVTAEKDFTLAINATPTITATATLPAASAGLPYSHALTLTGGTSPKSWTIISGTLPDGLMLDTTGTLSGTPTVVNTFNFTAQVTDAHGATASKAFSLTINNALTITATSPIPAATAGKAYNKTINATGGTGTLVWSITSGALPVGLGINSANGLISGTTTMTGTANFTVKVTDGNNTMVTREFALTMNDAPVITSASLPEGSVSIAYNYQMTGTGGTTPRAWSKTGNLPAGLTLTSAGLISGTPTASGTFNLTLRLTDQNGAMAERALTLNVLAAPQGPNLAAGQTLHSQRCASCHSSPSFTPSAGASKLILDSKGNHYNNALSLNDLSKTNLAFYISSLDATAYLINGVIKDAANQGLGGVTVTATSGYLPTQSAVSNPDGTYSITGLKAGDYFIKASKAGATFAPAQIQLAVTKDKYWLNGNVQYTANVQPYLPPVNFTANLAPVVSLTEPMNYLEPMNNKAFVAPANIELTASASDPDGSVTKVAFYADGQLLGNDTTPEMINTTLRYSFTWNNVAARTNTLITAVVTDNLGINTTSVPVTLHVLVPIGAPNVSLTSGQAIYDSKCAHCHGPNPGRNPTWPGFLTDANGGVIGRNDHPGYLGSRYKIGREFLTFPYHVLGGVNSVSNYLGHVITESQKSDLAAYLASSVPERTSIAGTVRDASGQPVADATVSIASIYNPSVTVNTDAAGKYRVEGLFTGDYTVSATHGDIDPFFPSAYTYESYSGVSYPAIYLDPLHVINVYHEPNTPPTPLDFVPGHRVQGSVRNAGGHGFKDILIKAYRSGTGAGSGAALTDANGDFTLVLSDGSYTLYLSRDFQQPHPIYDYTIAAESINITVAGSDLSGKNFTVTAYPALTISGKVIDPTGAALTGVTVALAEAPSITTTTDANGDYILTSADPGTFTVTPSKANHLFTPSGQVVTVGAGSRSGVNFTGLLNSFNITGTIRTRSTSSGPPLFNTIPGEPVANVAVSVPGQTVFTDANGVYRLVLTNNTYTITAARNGYALDESTRAITVNSANQSGIDFTAQLLISYVSHAGKTSNDGSSWNSAKLSIQKAIDVTAFGGKVMVGGGTYFERISFGGISVHGFGQATISGKPLPFGEQFTRGTVVKINNTIGVGTNATRLDGFAIINGLATSPNTGGGIHCTATDSEAGPVVIANNSIGDNVASFKGGGIFLIGKATITNNVINNNMTESGGGAGIQVDFGSSFVTIANNLIVGNRADNGGGGIGTFAGSIHIANNTIVDNVVTNSGSGGIYFGAGFGSSTNANNIIAFNSSGIGTASSSVLSRNNCIFGNTNANYDVLTPGTGDISVDPQFADHAQFNYRLLSTSPLLDAGFNNFLVGPADLDAASRLEGANVDIGAYEYQSPNTAPTVALITPVNNASYSAPAAFTLTAIAEDTDGTVAKVEFYACDFLLGSITSSPYAFSVNGLQIGTHQLIAVATDNRGTRTVSAALTVTVHPLTDPSVAITIPTEGTRLAAPAQVTITASAADNNGFITKVEFFVNGAKVGEDTSAPYSVVWADAEAGTYSLTAKATDNSGATRTSSPVTITVINAPQIQQPDTVYTGGEFRLPMQLESGRSYLIQASTDLATWTTLEAFTAIGNAVEFVDTQAGNYPGRFYRIVQVD